MIWTLVRENAAALLLAAVIDLLIGDPRWLLHPVVCMGKTISFTENILRKKFQSAENSLRQAGYLLVAVQIVFWGILPAACCYMLYLCPAWVRIPVSGFLMSQMLAKKGLYTESMKVYTSLMAGDIGKARWDVSMIVGRDTKNLDAEGVIKAAVETVAENFSDGVIAPYLYMLFFGLIGGYLYKVINTMDSMIGYKNEQYLHLGFAAAKLDDMVNYIPARFSALLLLACGSPKNPQIGHISGKEIYKIYKDYSFAHASPNSAHTESVVAGALGVELAGDAYYFGKLYKKPTIGKKRRDLEVEDIRRVNHYIMKAYAVVLLLTLFFMLFVARIGKGF